MKPSLINNKYKLTALSVCKLFRLHAFLGWTTFVASAGSYAKALTYFYKTNEDKESIPHRVVTPAPRVVLVVVAAGVPEIVVVVIDVLVHLRHVPLVRQPVNLR